MFKRPLRNLDKLSERMSFIKFCMDHCNTPVISNLERFLSQIHISPKVLENYVSTLVNKPKRIKIVYEVCDT